MPRRCRAPACNRSVHANGLCSAHNMRAWHGWDIRRPVRTIHRLAPGEAEVIRKKYVSPPAPTAGTPERISPARTSGAAA